MFARSMFCFALYLSEERKRKVPTNLNANLHSNEMTHNSLEIDVQRPLRIKKKRKTKKKSNFV